MRYYVYALIDPSNDNKPFYIGKGIDNRVKSHFKEALSVAKTDNESEEYIDVDIGIIAENEIKEYENQEIESPKIKKLRELFSLGYGYDDIARILAKNLDEPVAFALEAFMIKAVYGLKNLTNKVEGGHSERFRPYNNWECIEGFDFPSKTNSGRGKSQSRIEKLKLMLAERIDQPLLKIAQAFPNLKFEKPNVIDSGELGIEADIRGTRIKIFTRKKNIQIELRGRRKEQHIWIRNHFKKLGAEHLLRNDHVFIPEKWKGSKNMVSDVQIAIKRVRLLLEIVNVEERKQLSSEALRLLEKTI